MHYSLTLYYGRCEYKSIALMSLEMWKRSYEANKTNGSELLFALEIEAFIM